MRFFLLILYFFCFNVFSSEDNQANNVDSFFNKKPAEQREIFIKKFQSIISNKTTDADQIVSLEPTQKII